MDICQFTSISVPIVSDAIYIIGSSTLVIDIGEFTETYGGSCGPFNYEIKNSDS